MIPANEETAYILDPESKCHENELDKCENAILLNNIHIDHIHLKSRTDKPPLAFDIYKRFLENVPKHLILGSQCNNTSKPIDKRALLLAAYSGCKLQYRN